MTFAPSQNVHAQRQGAKSRPSHRSCPSGRTRRPSTSGARRHGQTMSATVVPCGLDAFPSSGTDPADPRGCRAFRWRIIRTPVLVWDPTFDRRSGIQDGDHARPRTAGLTLALAAIGKPKHLLEDGRSGFTSPTRPFLLYRAGGVVAASFAQALDQPRGSVQRRRAICSASTRIASPGVTVAFASIASAALPRRPSVQLR